MAFTVQQLGVLAYANGRTRWCYQAQGDDVATVTQPGFFAGAGDMLGRGDIIQASCSDGGAILYIWGEPRGTAEVIARTAPSKGASITPIMTPEGVEALA